MSKSCRKSNQCGSHEMCSGTWGGFKKGSCIPNPKHVLHPPLIAHTASDHIPQHTRSKRSCRGLNQCGSHEMCSGTWG